MNQPSRTKMLVLASIPLLLVARFAWGYMETDWYGGSAPDNILLWANVVIYGLFGASLVACYFDLREKNRSVLWMLAPIVLNVIGIAIVLMLSDKTPPREYSQIT